MGPKIETEGKMGVRYHAKERLKAPGVVEWEFEERESLLLATSMLLVRVIIGKVEDGSRLVEILRSIPIRQGQAGWNCIF